LQRNTNTFRLAEFVSACGPTEFWSVGISEERQVRGGVIVALSLTLTGAAVAQSTATQQEVYASMESVRTALAGEKETPGCATAQHQTTLTAIKEMDRQAALYELYSKTGIFDRRPGDYQKYIEEFLGVHLLMAADAYLAANCLDDANALYREVVTKITSPQREALRQRALLGVDDVRAARK
jgi:hypothetical protein